jgi:hypothetical protein
LACLAAGQRTADRSSATGDQPWRKTIRFVFAHDRGSGRQLSTGAASPAENAIQRGFVVLRLGLVGVAELGPRAVRPFVRSEVFFLDAAGMPAEARDEWRGRWRTAFFGAASAIEASVRTARSAATIILRVLRINK